MNIIAIDIWANYVRINRQDIITSIDVFDRGKCARYKRS